jgi:hypothetical protein
MTTVVLCCVAGPLHGDEEDRHVLMLYGLDPYLPPFLVMDKAVRESLASENSGRVIFFSESLDSQRFAMEPLEPQHPPSSPSRTRPEPLTLSLDICKQIGHT